tara:strand:+ start:83 stop:1210 length:1128 start_codon:yes stop_codon:yes gene_type:complete
MGNKKLTFYIIYLFFIILIFESFSWGIIYFINKHPIIIKSKNFHKSKKLINEFNEYLDLIPYVDDALEFRKFIDIETSKNLFFDTHRAFNKNNDENILLQGDSWAAAANEIRSKKIINDILIRKNFGLINGGKTSYSISPMNIQLDIILKKFLIQPSIVIAIIDQTDIGDELHRYQSLSDKSLELTDTKITNEFKKKFFKTLDSKGPNIIKLFFLFKEFWISRLNQFNYDYHKTIKYVFKRISYLFTNTPVVIAPLKYGINDDERILINNRFEKYINNVFKNKIEKLIFVSHPHKNHIINKTYKVNISTIIENVIRNSKHKKKIIHINFEKNIKKIYKRESLDEIFVSKDKTSHLTNESYQNTYFPHIFDNCCKE